jgi:hypothetical protein
LFSTSSSISAKYKAEASVNAGEVLTIRPDDSDKPGSGLPTSEAMLIDGGQTVGSAGTTKHIFLRLPLQFCYARFDVPRTTSSDQISATISLCSRKGQRRATSAL